MSKLVSRAYTGPADLNAMIDLIKSLRNNGQVVYPIAADLHEELADPDVQITARLWETASQRLVGFAYVNRYDNMVDVFQAQDFTPEIELEMINWVVAAVQRRTHDKAEIHTLDASALESDSPRLAFLERHGFARQRGSSILMARSLDQPTPDPRMPAGFTYSPYAS